MRQTTFDQIEDERRHQDQQWGGPDHDDDLEYRDWDMILTRLTKAAYDAYAGDSDKGSHEWRRRLIQIAAVAIAAAESFDRRWPSAMGRRDEVL